MCGVNYREAKRPPRGLGRISEGSVGPTGPTLLAEILEFNSEIVRGQHLSPLQFSPGPLTGLPAALRGGTATPSTTGCSSSTRTAALPKRVIWHDPLHVCRSASP